MINKEITERSTYIEKTLTWWLKLATQWFFCSCGRALAVPMISTFTVESASAQSPRAQIHVDWRTAAKVSKIGPVGDTDSAVVTSHKSDIFSVQMFRSFTSSSNQILSSNIHEHSTKAKATLLSTLSCLSCLPSTQYSFCSYQWQHRCSAQEV